MEFLNSMFKEIIPKNPVEPVLLSWSCYTIEISFNDFFHNYRYKLQFMAKDELIAQGMAVNYAKELAEGPMEYFNVHYVNIEKVQSLESLIKDKELITCELKGNR